MEIFEAFTKFFIGSKGGFVSFAPSRSRDLYDNQKKTQDIGMTITKKNAGYMDDNPKDIYTLCCVWFFLGSERIFLLYKAFQPILVFFGGSCEIKLSCSTLGFIQPMAGLWGRPCLECDILLVRLSWGVKPIWDKFLGLETSQLKEFSLLCRLWTLWASWIDAPEPLSQLDGFYYAPPYSLKMLNQRKL